MQWIRNRRAGTVDPDVALQRKLARREALTAKLIASLRPLSYGLLAAGLLYIFAIPFPHLSKGTYVSENALQPAQVNSYWSWSEVQSSDVFANRVLTWDALSSTNRCKELQAAFESLGLPTATQSYRFSNGTWGCNAYATIRAPKTDGSESIVLAASWKSRDGGRLNTRGVALVLGLAHHLSKFSLWSKDIILLVADDYIEGTHAFLAGVHEVQQSNLQYEPLKLNSGPIWVALHLDYPHHSFDRIGLFFEGVNGLLPNLDLVTSVIHIIKWVGATPSVLHGAVDVDWPKLGMLEKYKTAFGNVFQQVSYGALGQPSGPEGVYSRYRIDALALYAVPAEGPYGFYHLGRVVEASVRSLNNLLERFHASAFLYIMTSPRTFVPLAHYIAAPVLVGVGLTVKGLHLWFDATRAGMPSGAVGHMMSPLMAMAGSHAAGFWLLDLLRTEQVSLLMALVSSLLAGAAFSEALSAETRFWLEPFSLLVAGMAISVSATLNVSCAILLAFLVGLPQMLRPASRPLRILHVLLLVAVNPLFLLHLLQHLQPLEDWRKFDLALVPLSLLVVWPLQVQSAALSAAGLLSHRTPKTLHSKR